MAQPPSPDTQNQPGTDFTRFSTAEASELLHYKTQLEAVRAEAGFILLADPDR